MTEQASRNEPGASPDEPEMARFLRDWAALWREEMQAQTRDASPWGMLAGMGKAGVTRDMAAAFDLWRATMLIWADVSGAAASGSDPSKPSSMGTGAAAMDRFGVAAPVADAMREFASFLATFREPAAATRTEATAAAPDARDAEVERLARRVDELEARLAELEKSRRRRR